MTAPHPRAGRVLHTGNLVVDLSLRVPRLPRRGEDLSVEEPVSAPGGAWHALAAATGLGARCVFAGSLGTGPRGDFLRARLKDSEIPHPAPRIDGTDSGCSLALVEPDGERTFLSTTGAEAVLSPETLRELHPTDEDVVVVSGYTVARAEAGGTLLRWLRGRDEAAVLFDPGPVISRTEAGQLRAVCAAVTALTCTEEEGRELARALGIPGGSRTASALAAALHRGLPRHPLVLLHQGAAGAVWCEARGAGHLDALSVPVLSANGAGDTVAGVLAWGLAGPWLSPAAHVDAVRETLELAMAAASRHISTPPGTPPADRAELQRFAEQHHPIPPDQSGEYRA
jgi:sugar/nucleoside kinase (ribokinase family)